MSARRYLLVAVGWLAVALGMVGIAVPGMPTTVFLIGAAICYAKASPGRYRRLIARGRTGELVDNYIQHGVIPRAGKRAALSAMAISALILCAAPLGMLAKGAGLLGLTTAAVYVWTRPELFVGPDLPVSMLTWSR